MTPELQGPVMRTMVLYGILGLAVLARIWLGRRFIPRPRAGAAAALPG
jgi:hypothetical protein